MDRKTQKSNPIVIDFGTRAISDQNFSKVVALPKVALQNFGNITQVNIKLVQQNDEKYLKLSPANKKGGEVS